MTARACCNKGVATLERQRGGHCRDGECWTCTTCWAAWVHVCDEAEGCGWAPLDGVPRVRLEQWAVKALRDAIRGSTTSRVSPSSWQSAVRRGWMERTTNADGLHVVTEAGHKALAGHQLAVLQGRP